MGTKTLVKQWKRYTEQLKQPDGVKLPEMEALRPFMGKRGGVSKRQTRSKKQQAAFKKAAAGVKEAHGTKHSAAHFKQAAAERAEKNAAKKAKGAKTAGQNAAIAKARKQHKKKPDFNNPLSQSAKKTVEEAERKYSRMVDILDKGSRSLLSAKVRYEIYKTLDEEEVSEDDIEEFIDKLLEVLDDIPAEAKDLNSRDDFYDVLMQIRDMGIEEKDDLKDMFVALVDYPNATDELFQAIDYWQENNQIGMGFGQFMEELEGYNDMWDPDNYAKILRTEEE